MRAQRGGPAGLDGGPVGGAAGDLHGRRHGRCRTRRRRAGPSCRCPSRTVGRWSGGRRCGPGRRGRGPVRRPAGDQGRCGAVVAEACAVAELAVAVGAPAVEPPVARRAQVWPWSPAVDRGPVADAAGHQRRPRSVPAAGGRRCRAGRRHRRPSRTAVTVRPCEHDVVSRPTVTAIQLVGAAEHRLGDGSD